MQTIPEIVLIIFTAVTAIGVLIQAFVMVGLFLAAKKATEEFREISGQFRQHALPALATTRNLLEDISPKIKVATSNLVEISGLLRSQVEHVNKTVVQVVDTAQAQVTRVDQATTAVIDGITQATAAVQNGIAAPLKQLSGVLNGLKAGFEVFRRKERPAHVEVDGSNFV